MGQLNSTAFFNPDPFLLEFNKNWLGSEIELNGIWKEVAYIWMEIEER